MHKQSQNWSGVQCLLKLCIIVFILFVWRNVLLGEKLQIYAKNSNLKIFRALLNILWTWFFFFLFVFLFCFLFLFLTKALAQAASDWLINHKRCIPAPVTMEFSHFFRIFFHFLGGVVPGSKGVGQWHSVFKI